VWLLLAAYTAAAPLVQAMGRLRCLVQGCCHGHEAPAAVGIRYSHPRSRVVRLSTLGGVPVHPTPLYSILWNAGTALVVGRLWSLHLPLHFIAGTYLAVNGFGRFVEEAYRGEPQTVIHAGLRLYQWVAIGSVLAGAAITALPAGVSGPAPAPEASWAALGVAALYGAVIWLGLGVDFPESNRRFARLV
jgi:prolipoprotein diacylglyceryltransferase